MSIQVRVHANLFASTPTVFGSWNTNVWLDFKIFALSSPVNSISSVIKSTES